MNIEMQGSTHNDYLRAHTKYHKDIRPPYLHIRGYTLHKAWQACTVYGAAFYYITTILTTTKSI